MRPCKPLPTLPPQTPTEMLVPVATAAAAPGPGSQNALRGDGQNQSPTSPVLHVEEGPGNLNALEGLPLRGVG